MERETDQEIKDRQTQQLDEERQKRAERLGHDIRVRSLRSQDLLRIFLTRLSKE